MQQMKESRSSQMLLEQRSPPAQETCDLAQACLQVSSLRARLGSYSLAQRLASDC